MRTYGHPKHNTHFCVELLSIVECSRWGLSMSRRKLLVYLVSSLGFEAELYDSSYLVWLLNTYSLRQQLIMHSLRLDLAPLPTHAKRCISDGNGLGVEQIACLKEMLQFSPLQYPDLVSSCHRGYTRNKRWQLHRCQDRHCLVCARECH